MSLPSSLIFRTLHSAWKNIVSANGVVGCCSVSMVSMAGPINKLPTDLLHSAMLLKEARGPTRDAQSLPQLWPLILQIVVDSFIPPLFILFFLTRWWVISENNFGLSFPLNNNLSWLIVWPQEWSVEEGTNWCINRPCANWQSLDCPLVCGELMDVFNWERDKTRFHFRWIPLLALGKRDFSRQL